MSLSLDLTGRLAVVTGGVRGVGLGISRALLDAGAEVVAVARREPESLPSASGRTARFASLDVRDPAAAEAFFDGLERVDVLVNNAGGTPFLPVAEGEVRTHTKIIELNLTSALIMSRAANARMQAQDGGGSIIMISSVSGVRPSPGTAAYGAAKAGLDNLATSLAVEWAPRVRVNSLTLGMVRTEQSHLHYGDEDGIAAVAGTVPLGRLADPYDIGAACAFLASDLAGYISGSALLLHGGGERPAFLDAANVNKKED
ncbi:SDR family oxidoreductase [Actinomadura rudentiformis]|uniref:SDR family oxidoreductase n=1 Tax=Actinomadura rudentiformis TaxID=359158 RepID=A0A6H9YWN3_9ACTN|nr:SDR family oxidoreductase [Actinomadura rudentiformis]KAB2346862.1 SDR family oxidoreductase [Actinomadura rudentiformis]